MSSPTPTPRSDLWKELESVVAQHIEPGHDVIDTVNRLLRKNPWLRDSGSALQIPKVGLDLLVEAWELDQLWLLVHASQVTAVEPVLLSGAVVVLRWDRAEYLMDGRRRINHWKRQQAHGPHRTLVVQRANDI
jgi:hypothetical protein